MTGTQLWHVMGGAHAFYPSWPANLTEDQNDLIADFLDDLRDWMDVTSFQDSYRAGRDAAKDLDKQIRGINETGLFVGATTSTTPRSCGDCGRHRSRVW